MIFGLPYGVFWLSVAVVLALIEAFTMTVVTVWFSIGAVFAMFVALLGAGFWNQFTVFLLTSAVMLIFTRPVAKKYVNAKAQKTNADKLVGQTAVVVKEINNLKGTGEVKINGMIWTARTEDENEIHQGELVEVLSISGVKLIVRKKQ